jgi:N-acetyl-beta-hexosaminidase
LSEVLWSGAEQRDWIDFQKRLPKMFRRYDALGWNYKQDAAAVPLEKPVPLKQ